VITTLLATLTFTLSPAPDPTPSYPTPTLLPNYVTNGDGSRMQCTPNLSQCWRDTTGLPSYLTGA